MRPDGAVSHEYARCVIDLATFDAQVREWFADLRVEGEQMSGMDH